MHRIEKDWYTLMNVIIKADTLSRTDSARKQLREELLAIAGIWSETAASSDEFSG